MSETFTICWRPKSGGVLVTQFFKNADGFRRWIRENAVTHSRFQVFPGQDGFQEELDRHDPKKTLDADF